MIRFLAGLFFLSLTAFPAAACADEEPVRLPRQGDIKMPVDASLSPGARRLAPGGGLLLSFDRNRDGLISQAELEAGIHAAFAAADANADGNLAPLEQASWAESLPTRDDTLANPARFDPNLDRTVSLDEFSGTIHKIAAIYTDETTGNVRLAALEVREKRDPRQRINPFEGTVQARGGMTPRN